MPHCAVKSCRAKRFSVQSRKEKIYFYKLPRDPERKLLWLNTIGRSGWVQNKSAVVCSKHFDQSSKAKGCKLLKTAVPTLHLDDHVDEETTANEAMQTQTRMKEGEIGNAPGSEHTFLPMEIKIEAIGEPSNNPELLAEERMVIGDIVQSIMYSLDLLVKSDPDTLRSTNVKNKIIEALFCYHHIIDDKDLNLSLCLKKTDVFQNDNKQPFMHVETVVNANEEANEYYEEVDYLSDEEDSINEDILTDEECSINDDDDDEYKADLSSDEEDPEWESIKNLRDQIERKEKMEGIPKNPGKSMSVSQIQKLVERLQNGESAQTDKPKVKNKNVRKPKQTGSKGNECNQSTSGSNLAEFNVDQEVKMDVVVFESAMPRFVCEICDVALVSEHHLTVHKMMCRRINFYYGNPKLEGYWNNLTCPLCDVKCNNKGNLKRHFISHRILDIEKDFEAVKQTYFYPNDVEMNMKLLKDFITELEKWDDPLLDSSPSNHETTNSLDTDKSDSEAKRKTQTKKISDYVKFNLRKIVYDIDFDKDLYCNTCDMLFNSKDELEDHIKKVNDTDAFICNHCDETFAVPMKLIRHVKTHTGLFNPKSLYLNFKKEDKEACPRQADYKIYACKYCLQMFVQVVSLQGHRKHKECKRKSYRCLQREKDVFKPKKKPEDNIFQCDKCDKSYKSYMFFKDHLETHVDQTIKYCSECGKGFQTKLKLQLHMYGAHSNKRYAVCEVCGANMLKNNYQRHMILHTDLTPYECHYCNRTFKYKESIICHIRTHTKDKPWQCKYCGAEFSEKRNYNTHINIHEGKTPYKCNQCPSAFVSKLKLNKHMSDHTDCRV